jgi:hypothetical protein
LDAPARLLPIDNVDADPIGEDQKVCVDEGVCQHITRICSWQEIRCGKAIPEENDRLGAIVLPRHPAEPLDAGARCVDGFGPFPGARIFVFLGVDELVAVDAELSECGRACCGAPRTETAISSRSSTS